MLIVKFTPTTVRTRSGKLADAELHFTGDDAGPLAGLKLIGFAIWERRGGSGRNVTFPARQYSVNGERRSFALLRPCGDYDSGGQQTIRAFILDAFAEYERLQAEQHAAAADAYIASQAPAPLTFTTIAGATVRTDPTDPPAPRRASAVDW